MQRLSLSFPRRLLLPLAVLACLLGPARAQLVVVDSVDVLFDLILTGVNVSTLDISRVNRTNILERLEALADSDDGQYGMLRDATVKVLDENLGSNTVTVNECQVGSYVSPSTGACTPCPPGYYSEQAKASSPSDCVPCAAGTFSNASGAGTRLTCQSCPVGTFSAAVAASSVSVCRGCGANMVSNPGARVLSDCVCLPGYYMVGGNGTALGTCVRCEPGFYCGSGVKSACPESGTIPPKSTSLPGAAARDDCYCLAGYYGQADSAIGCTYCTPGYYCTGKLNPDPRVKNQAEISACPANSNSPAGAKSLGQCTCVGNYRKQLSSPAERAISVTATQCNCTNEYQCSAGACLGCTDNTPCASGQTLTCAQGHVRHEGTSAAYGAPGFPGSGTWYIAPPGAQRVFLRVYGVSTGSPSNRLQVYACGAPGCPAGSGVTNLDTVSNAPVNDRVISTPPGQGVVMLVWEAVTNLGSSVPFQVEYASLRACESSANVSLTLGTAYYGETGDTVYPTQVELSWPVLAWVGDTLTFSEYPSQSQVAVDVYDRSWRSVKGLGFTQWEPGSAGTFYVVDLSMPSRFRQLQVLTPGQRTVTVFYSAASGTTSFALSGDYVSGTGSPDVVLVSGDTLVFSRLASTGGGVMLLSWYNASSGAYTAMDAADVVGTSTATQAQPSLTWSTGGRDPGTYYYASALGTGSVRVGRILLYEAPGGAQCIVCQAGEYCYDGAAVKCPPNSVSPAGSTAVSACQCSAGFTVSTTDMASYQSGQAVDSGGRHSCAIGSDGALWCWGANEVGQLGLGFVGEPERAPRQVPGLSDVRNVSLGDDFTCAVVGDVLMVKCWGGNLHGQLGLDAVDEYLYAPPGSADLAEGVPLWAKLAGVSSDADGVQTVNAYATRHLSCGNQSCCAIITKASGADALTCWGRGDSGQLGEGDQTSKRRLIGTGVSTSIPLSRRGYAAMGAVTLGFGTEIAVLVTMGGEHACAVMESGAVWCWGSNANGAVGKGSGQAFYAPTAVSLGGPAKTVNCYALVCCAVMSDTFGVKCWGKGGDGRLGTSLFDVGVTAASMGVNLQSVMLGTGLFAIDVNVGRSQTCALLSSNGVKCWGTNGTSVIGDNPPIEMSDLLPNVALLGTQVVLQMSGKGLTTCVVMSDYRAACWGNNDWGQLGAATPVGVARNMTLVSFGADAAAWTALASSGTPQTLSCVACPANTFCLGGAATAQACPANTMSGLQTTRRQDCKCVPGTKLTGGNCVLCSGAEWCLNGLATSCGQFSSTTADGASASSACACGRGYYYSSVTKRCTACVPGQFKDAVSNAGNCSLCPAGSRSSATALGNASGCERCGAGSYSPPGSTSCTPCGVGTAAAPGSRACVACGPGFFSDGTEAACRPCEAGTYDDEPRNGEPGTCTDCGPGFYSAERNATSISACRKCPAGNVSDGGAGSCRPCGAGEFSREGTQVCLVCPANSTSAPGSGYGQCRCLAGLYKRVESDGVTFVCVPCGAGEYAGFDKSGACDKCPGGTASGASMATSSAVCGQCQAGRFAPAGSGACSPCAAWSFSGAAGSSACTNCSLGFYSGSGSSQCFACPPGKFSLVPISTSGGCRVCEAGKYCVGAIEAARSGVRQVEDCPLGTYNLDTGMSSLLECSACPEGSFCPSPVIIGACPLGTTSNASSTSQMQCVCMVGYSCNYKRVVNAVVTLLMSLQDWNRNLAVRTAFVNAVAQSARTTPDKVMIKGVVSSKSSVPPGVGGARRLLGAAKGRAEKKAVEDGEGPETHLALEILDGLGSGLDEELDARLVEAGLGSSAGKIWIEPHSVEALPLW